LYRARCRPAFAYRHQAFLSFAGSKPSFGGSKLWFGGSIRSFGGSKRNAAAEDARRNDFRFGCLRQYAFDKKQLSRAARRHMPVE